MDKRSHHKQNVYAQLNVHVEKDDARLVAMVEKSREEGVPLSVIGEAGIRLAWIHFPDQLMKDAKDLMSHRLSAPMWAVKIREEAAREKAQAALIKEENEQLKLQLARLRK